MSSFLDGELKNLLQLMDIQIFFILYPYNKMTKHKTNHDALCKSIIKIANSFQVCATTYIHFHFL